MTPATATTSVWTNWTWPEDVKAFAAEQEAEHYLEPLREALARLFPTATEAKVVYELDPELRDVRSITFDLTVPSDEIGDYVAGKHAWHAELFRIVPTTKVWIFRLLLIPL